MIQWTSCAGYEGRYLRYSSAVAENRSRGSRSETSPAELAAGPGAEPPS